MLAKKHFDVFIVPIRIKKAVPSNTSEQLFCCYDFQRPFFCKRAFRSAIHQCMNICYNVFTRLFPLLTMIDR